MVKTHFPQEKNLYMGLTQCPLHCINVIFLKTKEHRPCLYAFSIIVAAFDQQEEHRLPCVCVLQPCLLLGSSSTKSG